MNCIAGGVKGTEEMQLQEKSLDKPVSITTHRGRKVIIFERSTHTLKGLKSVHYLACIEVKSGESADGEIANKLENKLEEFIPAKVTVGLDINLNLGFNSASFDTEKLPNYELKDVIAAGKQAAEFINKFYGKEA